MIIFLEPQESCEITIHPRDCGRIIGKQLSIYRVFQKSRPILYS